MGGGKQLRQFRADVVLVMAQRKFEDAARVQDAPDFGIKLSRVEAVEL